ncbi:hypothetical protein FQZ97_688890 [compost metagenome]
MVVLDIQFHLIRADAGCDDDAVGLAGVCPVEDHVGAAAGAQHIGVRARAAVEHVVAGAAVKHVVAVTAVDVLAV